MRKKCRKIYKHKENFKNMLTFHLLYDIILTPKILSKGKLYPF